jgi:uncharacterized protein YceH (UPF0502 family)
LLTVCSRRGAFARDVSCGLAPAHSAIVTRVEPLHPVEVRVLGCLLEKDIATPEYYPLTLTALVNACNQKSSRDPVVNYSENTVERALSLLKDKQLASRITGAGHRVEKWAHRLGEWNLGRRELALLCVLMLRGPQTVGELRGRTERMHGFADMDEVERVLDSLASRTPDALAAPAARGRWVHLLGDPAERTQEHAAPEPAQHRAPPLEERVAALEREVAELKQTLESFRRQFE